jgi:two-component system sensor kinase FixL
VEQDQQAANVIVRLRSLLRGGESTLESLGLESVIRDALALTRTTILGARVQVQATIPTGLPRVHGDHVRLVQVLVNLFVNGCESMADVPVADRVLKLRVERTGPDRLQVSVDDCGVGLPVAPEERVFEPFYTTKDNGLGLGLSIGRSIADAHGGRLWAENNTCRGGAPFHLELPAAVSGARNR